MSILRDSFLWGVHAVEKLGPPPFQAKVTFDAFWIGDIQDSTLLTVEIKDHHGELGWMYGNSNFVAFVRNGQLLGIKTSALKEVAESVLKEKKFVPTGEKPQAGKLERIEKSIVGYLDISTLHPYINTL